METCHRMRFFFQLIASVFVFFITFNVQAVMVLPGDIAPLHGTAPASYPDLEGMVLKDDIIPFQIKDHHGKIILEGNYQDRIIQSDDNGQLIFLPRLRDLSSPGNASSTRITYLRLEGYGSISTDIDFIKEGSVGVGPDFVSRSSGSGDELSFRYDPSRIEPPKEGLFLSMRTDASAFFMNGSATIYAQTDSSDGVFSTTLKNIASPGHLATTESRDTPVPICNAAESVTVDSSLDIHVPSANYLTSDGTSNIWFNLLFNGVDSKGDYIWSLKDFGQNHRSSVLTDFINMKDPTDWQIDKKTGLRFRYTTANERRANEWLPGTFLIEAGETLRQASSGLSISLSLPMSENEIKTIDMIKVADHQAGQFIKLNQGQDGKVEVTSKNQQFYLYGSDFSVETLDRRKSYNMNGNFLTAASVRGEEHFLALGHVERRGKEGKSLDNVRIHGPGDGWKLDRVGRLNTNDMQLLAVHWKSNHTGSPSTPFGGFAQELCGFPLPNESEPLNPIHDDDFIHPCGLGDNNGWPSGTQDGDNHCDDGIDNDGDGLVDSADPRCQHHTTCKPSNGYPYHVHKDEAGLNYGLLGDITWCTRNKDVWQEELLLRAQTINQAFQTNSIAGLADNKNNELLPPYNEPHEAYNAFKNQGDIDLMSFKSSKCWMLPTIEQADSCKKDKNACGPFSPGSTHEYPYGGLKNARVNAPQYQGASWEDLEHASKLPANQNLDYPLDLWQIFTNETGTSYSPEYGIDVDDALWGGTAYSGTRSVVINGSFLGDGNDSPEQIRMASPHEFGHAFGCRHSDAVMVENPNVLEELPPVKGHTVIGTTDNGDPESTSGATRNRFGTKCTYKMINEQFDFNVFNRNQGLNDNENMGPSFGW